VNARRCVIGRCEYLVLSRRSGRVQRILSRRNYGRWFKGEPGGRLSFINRRQAPACHNARTRKCVHSTCTRRRNESAPDASDTGADSVDTSLQPKLRRLAKISGLAPIVLRGIPRAASRFLDEGAAPRLSRDDSDQAYSSSRPRGAGRCVTRAILGNMDRASI
jgi:hypothetical protein